ncbi:MAG: hypothetical protein KGI37_07710 [Alphaproteobacteria bacterium]|nr:hypothetical protein [Alphaproteobacteria bacterium]
MSKKNIAASFAHLLGRAPKARAEDDKPEEQEDDRKQRADESDEDYARRMEELDDEEARRAEDETDGGEDVEDDDKKGKKGKKGKKAEGDDPKDEEDDDGEDGEDEMKGKGEKAAARRRERARCAAIFAAPEAATRPDIAAHLAFNTAMPRKEAIGMLKTVAASDVKAASMRGALGSRMASVQLQPKVQATAQVDASLPADPKVRAIIDAGKRRRGEK